MSATNRQVVSAHMATEVVAGASLAKQVASCRTHAKPQTTEVQHESPKGPSEHDERACEPHHRSSCRKATHQPMRMATMVVDEATLHDAQAQVWQETAEQWQTQDLETRMQHA